MTKRSARTSRVAMHRATTAVRSIEPNRQRLIEAAMALVDTYSEHVRLMVDFWERTQADRKRLAELCIARGLPVPEGLASPIDDEPFGPVVNDTVPDNVAWHDFRAIAVMLSKMPPAARKVWSKRFSNEMRRRIGG